MSRCHGCHEVPDATRPERRVANCCFQGVGFGVYESVGGSLVRVATCETKENADRVRDALADHEQAEVDRDELIPLAWPSHGPDCRVICHVASLEDGTTIATALNLAEDLRQAAAEAVRESPEVDRLVLRLVGR